MSNQIFMPRTGKEEEEEEEEDDSRRYLQHMIWKTQERKAGEKYMCVLSDQRQTVIIIFPRAKMRCLSTNSNFSGMIFSIIGYVNVQLSSV